jgi:hypothetical protein
MPSHRKSRADFEEHRYPVFADKREIGWLVWRARPRQSAGWFLVLDGRGPEKLAVDAAIDELASHASDQDAWELHAEVAAILSTALALDAAERVVNGRAERRGRRFQRLERAHCEICVKGVAQMVLARAVPEMSVRSVSDVVTLDGELSGDAVLTVVRRLELLGGAIVDALGEDR